MDGVSDDAGEVTVHPRRITRARSRGKADRLSLYSERDPVAHQERIAFHGASVSEYELRVAVHLFRAEPLLQDGHRRLLNPFTAVFGIEVEDLVLLEGVLNEFPQAEQQVPDIDREVADRGVWSTLLVRSGLRPRK